LDLLAERCGPIPKRVYQLGGKVETNMVGSGSPLQIETTINTPFAVRANFAARHLADFSVAPASVHAVCSVNLPGPGGGPAAVFESSSNVAFSIFTATDDCAPCNYRGFRAQVHVG